MAEFDFTVPIMTEVLDHINNSKDVSSEALKEMYDQWVPTYDEVSHSDLFQPLHEIFIIQEPLEQPLK